MEIFSCILIGILLLILFGIILYLILKSPFKYPYHTTTFDISGKRSPKIEDLIDTYLIDHGFNEFSAHYQKAQRWKTECESYISKSKLKKRRARQFKDILDDGKMFRFECIKKQTRYTQKNYVKTAYTIYINVSEHCCDFKFLQKRFLSLSNINFECTLNEYHSKDQRKRMTKSLRDEIAVRDNFTCQLCGKYMPDGIGLQIDHIVPIAKGGKSVPSNLQVLCSKCNGTKSNH